MRNSIDSGSADSRDETLSPREQLLILRLQAAREEGPATHTIRARGKLDAPAPVSYAQERLWFLEQLGLVGATYNMPMTLRLEGELNVAALERSLTELIRRHESLRTRFESVSGSPIQTIDPPRPFPLIVRDLSQVHRQEQTFQIGQLSEEEIQRPFDLSEGPLLRASLLKLSAREHVLLLTIHHIVFDGWSWGVLHAELGALYDAFSQGRASPLPEPALQYADYAIWQRQSLQGEPLREQMQYWSERLHGAPPQLQLPTDRPRPAVESFKGAELKFELPATLVEALKNLGRREGSTLFMVLLAAYQLLLSRWSGQRDIVVGSPIAGRANHELDEVIGFFINMLVLRTDLAGDPTFRQLLEQVNRVTLGAYAHQELPFEKLVTELSPERNLTRQPVFQVVLALQNYPQEPLELPGLNWTWTTAKSGNTHFDLTLYLYEHPNGLSGVFEYATDLFDPETIGRIAGHFQTLLEAIAANPDCPVQQLPLLAEAERMQVLLGFNNTATSPQPNHLVHELFEAQATRTPRAVALICADQQLTYAELNRKANQVAHALLEYGLRPDERVALYMDRSVDAIVGLLGILKAGAAYVPLDTTYPTERLTYMLRDSAPVVLLTQERLKDTLPVGRARVVAIDAEEDGVSRQPECNLEAAGLGLTPQHVAYVIYTSGSTGTPKGVMVEHRNLENLIRWHCAAFDVREGSRCSCVAAFGFDAATWEIWPTLSAGATLVLAPSETSGDAEALLAWWERQALDVSFLPTPMAEFSFSRGIRNAGLRTLLVGGDRLRYHPGPQSFALVNNYGPTESTVVATSGPIGGTDAVLHIGRPISDTQIYVLDASLQPAPIGVAGEIHIGGSSVARGYLNRPDLTAERFMTNPFSGEPTARLYRSGDLGRWRPDGTIEYLGRNDHQVKVRGYRIELGEIEAHLLQSPHVKSAAVLAREDVVGERRLVAYVVADPQQLKVLNLEAGEDPVGTEIVAQWKTLYEETYSANAAGPSFIGWNSSYTGEPIPEPEMQEWLHCAVQRILALKPRRVLEIGCGVGLVLQHVAPHCAAYVGTDISASAIEQLQQWTATQHGLKHVELLQRSATELQDLPAGSFDMVVMNSVVQYFPDIEYLASVLREATRLLGPGGNIFLGDIRHLGSLTMFHSAVQLNRAAASVSVGRLRKRIGRAVAQDKELVIDPRFFQTLPGRLPGISAATVQFKRGLAANELTRHRYDVVLRTGEQVEAQPEYEALQWQKAWGHTPELEEALSRQQWQWVHLMSIPDARLARELAAQRLIETSDEQLQVSELRYRLSEMKLDAIDPEGLWKLSEANNYDVAVIPGEAGYFDAQLLLQVHADKVPRTIPAPTAAEPWAAYANDPQEHGLRQQLIPHLREYLKARLPEFMVPSAWVMLKRLPLTSNGKLDRNALPAPQSRPDELGEYIAPATGIERTLADIWAQVLRVDQVGGRDNFFELGGHSLLAVRVIFKINESLGASLKVTDLYQSPRVSDLAARIAGAADDDSLIDLSREAVLESEIVACSVPARNPTGSVLLTGATGFVGRFLLKQLLEDTDGAVFCLIRATSQHQAVSRIAQTLAKWDLWRDEFESRIVPIRGDLRLPRLGIDDAAYQMLSLSIDSIYHCATSMNHLETYAMAKPANVESASELLKLATTNRPKVLNYISTLGVFGSSGAETPRIVDEASPIDNEKHRNSLGYVASKWVGEKLVMLAGERGIPCNIFRLGLVWADTQQGRYDELQHAYRILKSSLISGCGIRNYQFGMAPTPVDFVARAVVSLANRHRDGRGLFHVSSPAQNAEGVFERCNAIAGTSLELMSFYDWICEIKRLHRRGQVLPIVPLIEHVFSLDEASFHEQQRAAHAASVRFGCVRTYRELELAGIAPPVLDDDLLRRSLQSMFERDTELRQLRISRDEPAAEKISRVQPR
ncbi:MAG: amino acid adenylation domain-containing protein [Gammaproteobacteria bacterium]